MPFLESSPSRIRAFRASDAEAVDRSALEGELTGDRLTTQERPGSRVRLAAAELIQAEASHREVARRFRVSADAGKPVAVGPGYGATADC